MNKEQSLVKLDLDNCTGVDHDRIVFKLKRAGYELKDLVYVNRSPSGKGWHVVMEVEPRPRSPYEVVALQAICGSDPYREAMQMNRARKFWKAPSWMRNAWNVLYRSHHQRQRHVNMREQHGTGTRN